MQEYCITQNQKKRDRDSRETLKSPKASQRNNARSRSPAQNQKNKETDEKAESEMRSKLLNTIKSQVRTLNVLPSQKVALENPSVNIYMAGTQKQANITCTVCKSKVCTAYFKRKSWLVNNYKRHVERAHLKTVTPTKNNGALDKFIQKKTTEKVTEEEEQSIPISDDEDENLRNSQEQNFFRKE